jgi:hypothetical protein
MSLAEFLFRFDSEHNERTAEARSAAAAAAALQAAAEAQLEAGKATIAQVVMRSRRRVAAVLAG